MLSKFSLKFMTTFPTFQSVRHLSQPTALTMNTLLKYSDPKALAFKYPRYETPFPVSINPNYSKWMDRYCTQWAIDNSGVMKSYQKYRTSIEKSESALFAAVTYPSANWHRCEKMMKWSLILFIADDYHDICVDGRGHAFNCQPFWAQLTDALDSFLAPEYYTRNEWPDFVKAIQQVLREIYFDYSPNQIKRSVDMTKDYILGNLDESKWSSNGSNDLDWNNYLNARLGSVGGYMALQLLEYVKEIELTDNEWNHLLIRRFNKVVSEELILINDYYTFRKEVVENNENFYQMKHPFTILVTNQGLTLQGAVDSIHAMILDRDEEIFRQLARIDNCPELQSDNIGKYIEGVKEILGGYWRHAITARRYHGIHFNSVIPIEGEFIYDRDQTVIKPSNNVHDYFKWNKPIPDNVQH